MKVMLSNPEGLLPWPGVPGRIVAGKEIIDIDPADPFWSQCLGDGTLVPVPVQPPAKPESKKKSDQE